MVLLPQLPLSLRVSGYSHNSHLADILLAEQGQILLSSVFTYFLLEGEKACLRTGPLLARLRREFTSW